LKNEFGKIGFSQTVNSIADVVKTAIGSLDPFFGVIRLILIEMANMSTILMATGLRRVFPPQNA
jgi:hypothetical protein